MSYKGDIALGQTVRGKFSTSAAAGSRVDFSSALEAADIRVYKNDSATERSSTSGYTVTSGFDSMTGVHHVAIDTSDNTDAGFFAAGNDYDVVLYPDETVDSLLVGAPIFSFSIENRFPFYRTFPALSVGAIPALAIKDRGVLQSVSSTGGALRSASAFGDNTLIGDTLQVEGNTQGYAQSASITDNALTGDTVTVEAFAVTPSGGTYPYIIFTGARQGAADLAGIANAVNDDAVARFDGLTAGATTLVIDGVSYDITRDPTTGYITSITAA